MKATNEKLIRKQMDSIAEFEAAHIVAACTQKILDEFKDTLLLLHRNDAKQRTLSAR
jgi:hypothetical protein